jgi:PRC-barrel domain
LILRAAPAPPLIRFHASIHQIIAIAHSEPRLAPASLSWRKAHRGEESNMVKVLFMTAAVSALLISDTFSQSQPVQPQPVQPQTSAAAPADSTKFIPMQSADQLVFSGFKGSSVVGPNDENVGAVNDLLFDKSGKILGVVVGVGGFLGIGQKNVAMDMTAFQMVPAASTGASSRTEDPSTMKLKVAWTKDQIQQAPDFKYYKAPATSAGPATIGVGGQKSTPPAPTPMAPRPPAQ